MIRLRAVQVVDRQLCARHVGLQYQSMVAQARQHHLKVDEKLGVRVAPVQLQAGGGDVGDVQRIFVCLRVIKTATSRIYPRRGQTKVMNYFIRP